MDELKNLLDKGLKLEDEFIQHYMEVLNDPSFSQYFENNQLEAKNIITKLLKESTDHKKNLENILNSL